MTLTFHTLDVFTNRRFAGNPLAVVFGDARRPLDLHMQTIAREFNLSETVFVMAPTDPANTARVRIFFPNGGIPFAGHPTVGCAILLASRQPHRGTEVTIRLEEEAGLVTVTVTKSRRGAECDVHRACHPNRDRERCHGPRPRCASGRSTPEDSASANTGRGCTRPGQDAFMYP